MRHIVSYERHFVAPPPESDKIELIYHLILVDPRFFYRQGPHTLLEGQKDQHGVAVERG